MLQTAFGGSCIIEHQFLSGIRDSGKTGSLWGMIGGVGRVRNSIHHSWLANGLGLGILCWGFKGVQEEIPSEEASILQIGSMAFLRGQCTSPQLHPCHRLFDQDGQTIYQLAIIIDLTATFRFYIFFQIQDFYI